MNKVSSRNKKIIIIISSLLILLFIIATIALSPVYYVGSFDVAYYKEDIESYSKFGTVEIDIGENEELDKLTDFFTVYKIADASLKTANPEMYESIKKGLYHKIAFDKQNKVWLIKSGCKYFLTDWLFEGRTMIIDSKGTVLVSYIGAGKENIKG